MSFKEVVAKVHKCAKESEKRGDVVLLELDSKRLTEVTVGCVSKTDFATKKNRDRNVSVLTEKETAMILEKNVNSESLEQIVLSILESHTDLVKEPKEVVNNMSFYCGMSQEALERADRKR